MIIIMESDVIKCDSGACASFTEDPAVFARAEGAGDCLRAEARRRGRGPLWGGSPCPVRVSPEIARPYVPIDSQANVWTRKESDHMTTR